MNEAEQVFCSIAEQGDGYKKIPRHSGRGITQDEENELLIFKKFVICNGITRCKPKHVHALCITAHIKGK